MSFACHRPSFSLCPHLSVRTYCITFGLPSLKIILRNQPFQIVSHRGCWAPPGLTFMWLTLSASLANAVWPLLWSKRKKQGCGSPLDTLSLLLWWHVQPVWGTCHCPSNPRILLLFSGNIWLPFTSQGVILTLCWILCHLNEDSRCAPASIKSPTTITRPWVLGLMGCLPFSVHIQSQLSFEWNTFVMKDED